LEPCPTSRNFSTGPAESKKGNAHDSSYRIPEPDPQHWLLKHNSNCNQIQIAVTKVVSSVVKTRFTAISATLTPRGPHNLCVLAAASHFLEFLGPETVKYWPGLCITAAISHGHVLHALGTASQLKTDTPPIVLF
jgi:hypothetical protein